MSISPMLLTEEEAAALYGISERKFAELRGDEAFRLPKPIQLGPRLLRWSRAELEAAIANMPRQRTATEPLQLAKARAARSGRTEVA